MAKSIHPSDLSFFSTLVSGGSLSNAARELDITTAAVSKRLSLMESNLGITLMNRTTRRMSLTPEGEIYLKHARKILGDIDHLEGLLWGTAELPKGLLRINSTLGFGRSQIAPLISSFIKHFPQVEIQLQLSVNPPALSDDSYDICFRFGPPPDSRVIAQLIAPNKRILVASPIYLKKFGTPRHPEDLAKHNCIGIRQGDEGYGVWRFHDHKQKNLSKMIKTRGNLTTNDGEIAVNWTLDGHGILLRAEWDVAKYIQSGRLVQILENYRTPDADIYAIYPEKYKTSIRVKSFIDFIVKKFKAKNFP